jgi:hypothetical protein
MEGKKRGNNRPWAKGHRNVYLMFPHVAMWCVVYCYIDMLFPPGEMPLSPNVSVLQQVEIKIKQANERTIFICSFTCDISILLSCVIFHKYWEA